MKMKAMTKRLLRFKVLYSLCLLMALAVPVPSFAGAGTALGRLLGRMSVNTTRDDWSRMMFGLDNMRPFRRVSDRRDGPKAHGEMVFYSNPGQERARIAGRYQVREDGDIFHFDINTGSTREAARPNGEVTAFLPFNQADRLRYANDPDQSRLANSIRVTTVTRTRENPDMPSMPFDARRYDHFEVVETRHGSFRQTLQTNYQDTTMGNGVVRRMEVRVDGGRIQLSGTHTDASGQLMGPEFNQAYQVGGPGDRILHAELDDSLRELRYFVLEPDGSIQFYRRDVEPFDRNPENFGLFLQSSPVQEAGPAPRRINDDPALMDIFIAEAQVYQTGARPLTGTSEEVGGGIGGLDLGTSGESR